MKEVINMITIHDIAREANTSIATVSRVLNNQSGYSEKTRQKVLKVADELGYESNAIAKSLVKKKTFTIGVVFPHISSQISYELLNGIEAVAHEEGYSIIVSYTYSDHKRTMNYLKTMAEKRIDGLIFTSEFLQKEYYDYLEKSGIPYILLSTKSQEFQVPYVKVDDYDAAYAAAKYLIDYGHKKIGMISGPVSDPIAGLPRVNGFKQAMTDHKLEHNKGRIIYGEDFGFVQGKQKLKKLIETHPEVTALFAAGDELAVGAMNMAQELGYSVPEDLSVIGYDNIMLSEMVYPPLTTIAQPFYDMGLAATELLFNMIEDKKVLSQQVILPFEIRKRKSVRELHE